ncbi:IS3 family transposase [Amedibacillus sp. YH-ame6]
MDSTEEKFQVIQDLISRDNNLLNISWLCEIAEVSRSGYYNWINNLEKRKRKDEKDKEEFEKILNAYKYRGYDKGIRGIYMRLLHDEIKMNKKKIRRLMKKFGLVCPLRKANPYRRMAKALISDTISPNEVERNFKQGSRKVILTDITYLFYGNNQKAYLSVMKDAYTNQVLSYVASASLEVDFVLETVEQLIKVHQVTLTTETIIHSDQGCHYTSISFRELLKNKNLRQSMSRRGNCWDNAPQESFFGHMKDEINISKCKTFEELTVCIDDYMDYYNNDRYQWNLAKLSPNEYYEYSISGHYPNDFLDPKKAM